MNDAKRAVPYAERNFQTRRLKHRFFDWVVFTRFFISSEHIKFIIGLFSYIGNIKDWSRKKKNRVLGVGPLSDGCRKIMNPIKKPSKLKNVF